MMRGRRLIKMHLMTMMTQLCCIDIDIEICNLCVSREMWNLYIVCYRSWLSCY